MEGAQEHQFYIRVPDTDEARSPEYANVTNQLMVPRLKYKWWLLIAIHSLFNLSGQSVATLLLRLYYEKGGKSNWLATLIQVIGFPIILCLRALSSKKPTTKSVPNQSSILVIASVYIVLGILLAASSMLGSIGISYLPVSTYSLILASQLAFNAFFSYFLNSQKFTPLIINSLVLLTISSTLLVVQMDSINPAGISEGKYIIGFLCTLCASASTGLIFSLSQFFFQKIVESETFVTVLDMIIYQSLVASCLILVGLFASGDWKDLKTEMDEFALGKLSYVMTLIGMVIAWQCSTIGATSLVFEVSAIFANVISTLIVPIVPILAVIFFHDKMYGVKVIALLLAIWGSISYTYQNYLDDCESRTKNENVNEVFEALPTERD